MTMNRWQFVGFEETVKTVHFGPMPFALTVQWWALAGHEFVTRFSKGDHIPVGPNLRTALVSWDDDGARSAYRAQDRNSLCRFLGQMQLVEHAKAKEPREQVLKSVVFDYAPKNDFFFPEIRTIRWSGYDLAGHLQMETLKLGDSTKFTWSRFVKAFDVDKNEDDDDLLTEAVKSLADYHKRVPGNGPPITDEMGRAIKIAAESAAAQDRLVKKHEALRLKHLKERTQAGDDSG